MKRYVITKEVLDIIHDADSDLNDVRRLIWSLPPIPQWATHFAGDPENLEIVNSWKFKEIPK